MTCSRDFQPATPTNNPSSAELSAALIRFVADGLVATVDSYRAGQLPLHRFAWELAARTDTLAELHPASRAVTRLRWLQRSIDNPHTERAAGGRAELSTDEENSLTVTLASLRYLMDLHGGRRGGGRSAGRPHVSRWHVRTDQPPIHADLRPR
jgi:hypothetical protein